MFDRKLGHRLVTLGPGAIVVSLMALTACGGAASPTPAPPFAGANIDTIGLPAIEAYTATLHFDSASPAPDSITIVNAGVRVHATIVPERGSIALNPHQLAEGRIIAVVRSNATSAPLGLTTGLTYMWVDSGYVMGWRTVMIPADTMAQRRTHRLSTTQHQLPRPGKAQARFGTYPLRSHADSVVLDPVFFVSNGACGNIKCCHDTLLVVQGKQLAASPVQIDSVKDLLEASIIH